MPTYIVKPLVGDALVGSAYLGEMELSERLRFARRRARLTQQQVADHFEMARPSVTQWEVGSSRPDQAKFVELSALFDVPLAWLMDGSGDPPTDARAPSRVPAAPTTKFLRNRGFKFYVKDWREFMGVKVGAAARAAGLGEDEYEAHEVYPINFNLSQVVSLAETIGVRGDQFWFPPPKRMSASQATAAPRSGKKTARK